MPHGDTLFWNAAAFCVGMVFRTASEAYFALPKRKYSFYAVPLNRPCGEWRCFFALDSGQCFFYNYSTDGPPTKMQRVNPLAKTELTSWMQQYLYGAIGIRRFSSARSLL